jgi:hypothetical protein
MPNAHANTKRCIPCVEFLRRKPKGTMTKEQILMAKTMAGSAPRDIIAATLGVSVANLKRSCPGVSFYYFNRYAANPEMVKEVCNYYQKHGRRATEEKFPEVSVRAIVERYKLYSPRKIPWKDNELIELVKFAGILNFKNQARFFNRPGANEGSIRSAWAKKFKCAPSGIHGLPLYKARLFVSPDCPKIKTQSRQGDGEGFIVLFCDAANYIVKDCPDFVRQAILAMAEFQKKLFGPDPRLEIENILLSFSSNPQNMNL